MDSIAQECCEGFEASFTFEAAGNPLGVIYHNASSGDADAIIWHFGDGESETGPQVADHLYDEPGLYQVCVVIENEHGCRSEFCRHIAVNMESNPCDDLIADFTYEVDLEHLTVHFNSLTPEAPFHIWHFGDGGTSDNNDPTHEYDGPGVYQVCLVVEDGDCRSEFCRDICVEDINPCAEFEVSFSSAVSSGSPLQINFDGNYAGGVDFIVWNFGDGETSHSEHPEHMYDEPGIYEVCLVGESEDGCRSEQCVSIEVGSAHEPCHGFEADFEYGGAFNPLGIEFTNASSGEWDFIVWHFGDGTSSNEANPDHMYEEPGIYEVCVVIELGDDCRSEYCMDVPVNVQENPCEGFTADFTYETSAGSLTVHFNDNSTADAPWHVWHFGDGSSSDGLNPVHEYTEPGTYQVCRVLESDNCRSEYCISVTVGISENSCEGFEAGFMYVVNLEEGGVHFENLSSAGAIEWVWHFGDGHASEAEEPHHEFDATGLHHVCLRIENAHGCVAEFCMNVFVPAYYFHMVPPTGVAFEDNATHDALLVYPNPFTDVVRLSQSGAVALELIDMQGRQVFVTTNLSSGTVDLSMLPSGLYVARATMPAGRTLSQRLLKP